jgi:hypothetical protein
MVRNVLLVIFGAGASKDSVQTPSHGNLEPPVTRDVFGPRFTHLLAPAEVPLARQPVDQMRELTASGLAVEVALRRLERTSLHLPATRMHLAAVRYYLQRVTERPGRADGVYSSPREGECGSLRP